MDFGSFSGSWAQAGQEGAMEGSCIDRPSRLKQQVYELQSELDSIHAHYQQLLDKLVPRWRHDREGLELTAAAAAVAHSTAAVHSPDVLQPQTAAAAGSQLVTTTSSAAAAAAAAASSKQQQASATTSSSSSSNGDAARSMLEGQLEAARRDLRSAQRSIARLESDMAAAAEIAATREASLNTQLRKAKATATAAASAAAEERAALAAQVRTLTSDISQLRALQASQLAAAQQQLQTLTEQLAAQQMTSLQQQQQQQLPPADATPSSSTKQAKPTAPAKTINQSAVSALQITPYRPASSSAAAAVAVRRPQTAAAAAAAGGSSTKLSWAITGAADLVQQQYKRDLTYAGALLESNVGKDISLATGNGSSSSSSSNVGSWGSRPTTAPAHGMRSGSNGCCCGNGGGSFDEAAVLLKLRQQVEREVAAELQQKAAELLQAYSAAAAAAVPAVAASSVPPAGASGPVDALSADAAAATAPAATAPAVAATDTSLTATAAPSQCPDALLLAEHAAKLQDEVQRLKLQLQSEQQQNHTLMVAVRSVQRTQAAAASNYLAGVNRPDSPPHRACTAAAIGCYRPCSPSSRPITAAAASTAAPWAPHHPSGCGYSSGQHPVQVWSNPGPHNARGGVKQSHNAAKILSGSNSIPKGFNSRPSSAQLLWGTPRIDAAAISSDSNAGGSSSRRRASELEVNMGGSMGAVLVRPTSAPGGHRGRGARQ